MEPKLQRAREQFAKLCDADRENALRGLFLGALFHQIKDEAGHGNFLGLAKAHLPAIPQQRRNELMRLWHHFAKHTGVALPADLALPDAQLALQLGADAAEHEIVGRALKFVGDLSLHALMLKWAVREKGNLGGARDKPAPKPVQTDPEALHFAARDEIGGALERLERLLLQENRLQFLVGHPHEIRAVVESLERLAAKVSKAAKPLLAKA